MSMDETLLSFYFERIKEIIHDPDQDYTIEERISDLDDYTFLIEMIIQS